MPLTATTLQSLPKVVLHDHLDGGLRPSTVLDLCAELGIDPPTADPSAAPDPAAVADWFADSAGSGSLPLYLATFDRTVALMQTAPALRRIAREFVEDMVADGVVYAEVRWAPVQHIADSLTQEQAVDAVQAGLDEGVAAAERAGRRIVVGQLLSYMRQLEPTDDLVEIAAARRGSGVVGIDLAGPEAGFPASRFRAQFERARELGVHVTIHAGEADGVSSMADALECGAERLGHGIRLADDIDGEHLGPTAARVREEGICLEVCPRSNLQTGGVEDIAQHPIDLLRRAGMRVAISSDNRLMSRTSTGAEIQLVTDTFGWSLEDLREVAETALHAGFAPAEQRRALLEDVVRPAYAAAQE